MVCICRDSLCDVQAGKPAAALKRPTNKNWKFAEGKWRDEGHVLKGENRECDWLTSCFNALLLTEDRRGREWREVREHRRARPATTDACQILCGLRII